jgi:mono/diheme cytochrome c family protein
MKNHPRIVPWEPTARYIRRYPKSMNSLNRTRVRTERGRSSICIAATALMTAASLVFAVTPSYAQSAADTYSQQCASCHGDKGKGDGPAGQYLTPKPSDFAVSLKGKSDDWIAKSITGGGPAVGGSPVMPPFPSLTADQVKALVDYLKHLGS